MKKIQTRQRVRTTEKRIEVENKKKLTIKKYLIIAQLKISKSKPPGKRQSKIILFMFRTAWIEKNIRFKRKQSKLFH